MKKVIHLISGPRNLSTALMYSFAQREGWTVLDEPFYGCYLNNAEIKIDHPASEQILQTMPLTEEKVVSNILKLALSKHVFIKGMAHHYSMQKPLFILDWQNVILIRHPKKLIASFSKVIENPELKDIGIKKAAQLFLFLTENDKPPIVIDSDELLKYPETYLIKLCKLLEISFS